MGWATSVRLLLGLEGAQSLWLLTFGLMVYAWLVGAFRIEPSCRAWSYALCGAAISVALYLLVGGWRARWLVARGVRTDGWRTRVHDLVRSERDGHEKVIAKCFTFRYEVHGTPYDLRVETTRERKLLIQGGKSILYDPRRPRRAIALYHMPGDLSLGENGTLSAAGGWPLHLLLLPVATMAVAGLLIARWILH
jgi:hypothetical protein